jgi:hypothetical protein
VSAPPAVGSAAPVAGPVASAGSTGPGGALLLPPEDDVGTGRRAWWRRNWLVVVLAAVAVLVAVGSVLGPALGGGGYLDPRAATPEGARAAAAILADQGVEVVRVDRLDDLLSRAGPGTTVLVVDTGVPLPEDSLARLADSGADLVLAAPGLVTLLALAPEAAQAGESGASGAVSPQCPDPDANAAGTIAAGGSRYLPEQGREDSVVVCYPQGDGAGTYAVIERGEGRGSVRMLGRAALLSNDELARQGHAALGLSALGSRPRLLWYLPDPLDPALTRSEAQVDPLSLLPDQVPWVAVQLGVVVLVAIAWRYRRFGRLVPERLPAVVRSVETAEGRARLYRTAGARDRAAALLRSDAARMLGTRLGVRRGARPADVAALTAEATGRHPAHVTALLVGPAPTDDTALVRLADDLDELVAALAKGRRPGDLDDPSSDVEGRQP